MAAVKTPQRGPSRAADGAQSPSVSVPVFVDRSGRRRRVMVGAGGVLGFALLISVVVLVAGVMTGAPLPLPQWPDGGQRDPGHTTVDGSTPSTGPSSGPPTAPAPPPAGERSPAPSAGGTAGAAATPSASTDRPGRGDERRAARASKSPGKPK
jgi:hypothetical protein